MLPNTSPNSAKCADFHIRISQHTEEEKIDTDKCLIIIFF